MMRSVMLCALPPSTVLPRRIRRALWLCALLACGTSAGCLVAPDGRVIGANSAAKLRRSMDVTRYCHLPERHQQHAATSYCSAEEGSCDPCEGDSCASEVCDAERDSTGGGPSCGHSGCSGGHCSLYSPEAGIFNFCAPPACISAPPPPPPGRFFPVPTRPVFSPRETTEYQ